MGIRLNCPNGHKLHLKSFLAGRRGICPHCGARFDIPGERLPELPPEARTVATSTPRPSRGTRHRPPAKHGSSAALAALDVEQLLGVSLDLPAAIAEAPGAEWHMKLPTGEQFGPADGPLMRQWLVEERVPAEAYVWREGWSEWQRAETVFDGRTAARAEAPAAVFPESFHERELTVTPATRAALGKSSVASKQNRLFILAMLVALLVIVPVLILIVTR
ncbi:MAG: DUF4339 domain-containing protein [Pirellulales bacterium]|nr:DUF4339 domain-containing protein [Pirellulales bacterium]